MDIVLPWSLFYIGSQDMREDRYFLDSILSSTKIRKFIERREVSGISSMSAAHILRRSACKLWISSLASSTLASTGQMSEAQAPGPRFKERSQRTDLSSLVPVKQPGVRDCATRQQCE